MSFQEQHSRIHKLSQLWAMMPPDPGFAQFNKRYTQVMQWSGNKMKPHRLVIVSVFGATPLNPSASQRIRFTAAQLCIMSFVYCHLIALYWYHTEATNEYIEKYLEQFCNHINSFSRSFPSISTKEVLKALQMQLAVDKQGVWDSNPAWSSRPPAPKRCRVDEDMLQTKSEIGLPLAHESDYKIWTLYLLNHFSDRICQLGKILYTSSELPP
jgi:hypothetical protein